MQLILGQNMTSMTSKILLPNMLLASFMLVYYRITCESTIEFIWCFINIFLSFFEI